MLSEILPIPRGTPAAESPPGSGQLGQIWLTTLETELETEVPST